MVFLCKKQGNKAKSVTREGRHTSMAMRSDGILAFSDGERRSDSRLQQSCAVRCEARQGHGSFRGAGGLRLCPI